MKIKLGRNISSIESSSKKERMKIDNPCTILFLLMMVGSEEWNCKIERNIFIILTEKSFQRTWQVAPERLIKLSELLLIIFHR